MERFSASAVTQLLVVADTEVSRIGTLRSSARRCTASTARSVILELLGDRLLLVGQAVRPSTSPPSPSPARRSRPVSSELIFRDPDGHLFEISELA